MAKTNSCRRDSAGQLLKCWVGNYDGVRRALVIARSKSQAAKLLGGGTSAGRLNDYYNQQDEVPTDLKPFTLYTQPMDQHYVHWIEGRCEMPARVKLAPLQMGSVTKEPDEIDELLEQHEVKRKARRAARMLDDAAVEIDSAWSQLSTAPASVLVRQAILDALKQVKIASAKLGILIERMPPVEKS